MHDNWGWSGSRDFVYYIFEYFCGSKDISFIDMQMRHGPQPVRGNRQHPYTRFVQHFGYLRGDRVDKADEHNVRLHPGDINR